jgi:hypothetical protein
VLRTALGFEHPDPDSDTGAPQPAQPVSRHTGVRIGVANQDLADSDIDDPVGARTRPTDMTTGFQCHRHRCAAQISVPADCGLDRHDLRMSAADGSSRTATEHSIAAEHDSTDRRIREGATIHRARGTQRQPHGGLGFHPACSIDSKNAR